MLSSGYCALVVFCRFSRNSDRHTREWLESGRWTSFTRLCSK